MYVHPQHACTDHDTLHALMAAHPLGAWVCLGRDGLVANHVPFLLDRSRGPLGTLIGHVSRANAVWRACDGIAPSVVMFRGPQAYITPGWYPGKAEHGRVVPTWNYVAAHAHGAARAIEDRGWMLDMLRRLTDTHEARRPLPWRVDDAPSAFIDAMLGGIVGIEIPIDRLEGKRKASQDEAPADRLGTVHGLREDTRDESRSMAEIVMGAIQADAAGRKD